MKNSILYILLLAVLLSLPGVSLAQSSNLVRGTVLDELDEPLIGAAIYEMDKTNRVHSTAVTDINGEFSIKVKNPKTFP